MESFFSTAITILLTGGGVGVVVLGIAKAWIVNAFKKAEQSRIESEKYKEKEYLLEQQLQQAQGRWMFWATRGMQLYAKKYPDEVFWNGEVKEAYESCQAVEKELKDLRYKRIAYLRERK